MPAERYLLEEIVGGATRRHIRRRRKNETKRKRKIRRRKSKIESKVEKHILKKDSFPSTTDLVKQYIDYGKLNKRKDRRSELLKMYVAPQQVVQPQHSSHYNPYFNIQVPYQPYFVNNIPYPQSWNNISVSGSDVEVRNEVKPKVLPKMDVINTVDTPDVYYDAMETADWYKGNRRPPDGEADSDRNRRSWNINTVFSYLERIPGRTRRLILTGLFGTTLGVTLDVLFGGTLGLTSNIIRSIISVIPGGRLLLMAFDGLGYIMSRFGWPTGENVAENIIDDPVFQNFAQELRNEIPDNLNEEIYSAAQNQLGGRFALFVDSVRSALGAIISPIFPVVLSNTLRE